ncbi:MAG: ACT domain-containing protein [Spartobacteria bacterium]
MAVASTTEKLNSPQVRQFSVFLQNKVGALREVVRLLDENNIIVLALSIAESYESAISRIIVSDPDRTEELFSEHNIPHSSCDLMVVELADGPGDLSKLLAALLMAEVNVHFSYPLLVRPRGRAVLALHVDDIECATSVLLGEGFKLLTQGDLSR